MEWQPVLRAPAWFLPSRCPGRGSLVVPPGAHVTPSRACAPAPVGD